MWANLVKGLRFVKSLCPELFHWILTAQWLHGLCGGCKQHVSSLKPCASGRCWHCTHTKCSIFLNQNFMGTFKSPCSLRMRNKNNKTCITAKHMHNCQIANVCISPCLHHIQAHHCTKSFLFLHLKISFSVSCAVFKCFCSRMWSSVGVGGCGSGIKDFGPVEEEPGVKITIVFVNLQHSQKRQRNLDKFYK